jgi:hypothetical protein
MNKKSKAKKTETEEFEFLMLDRFDFIKNDMNNEFFDPNKPIDKVSEGIINTFSGYKLIQTHKKGQPEKGVATIEHQNNPSYGALVSKRSDFSIFFNSQFKEKTFYDFADTKLKQHKRNIRFLALIFISDINSYDIRIDIRQFNSSVKKFDRKFALEEKLSKIVTDYYQKNYDELEEYLPKKESNQTLSGMGYANKKASPSHFKPDMATLARIRRDLSKMKKN